MPKTFLLILALTIILLTGFLTLAINNDSEKPPSKTEIDTAVNQAKYFYGQKQEREEDMSNGPCLTESLMPGWVVDIVHSPRQPIDDLKENQCQSFREGRAKHFVELDINGNLIRAR